MAAKSYPERVRWAMDLLAVTPADHVLEVGCGRGSLVSAVCAELTTGTVVAIDRSPTMIGIAAQRNADHVAAGKAELRVAALATAELPAGTFDKVVALNVNLFWVRPAAADLQHLAQLLAPAGSLYLVYELPGASRAEAVEERLRSRLGAAGFRPDFARGRTRAGNALLAAVAHPGDRMVTPG